MRRIQTLLFILFLCMALCVPSAALSGRTINVTLDGTPIYAKQPLMVGGVSYVPFRDFFDRNGLTVTWDSAERCAVAKNRSLQVTASGRNAYLLANGRYLYYADNLTENGVMYVPLRSAMKALGGSVSWVSGAMCAQAHTGSGAILSGDAYYNQTDLYWLSRIISAESAGQPLKGKLAVGSVVLNRVESPNYPNSIYDVVFDTKFGVQFTPVANGRVYDEPTEESVIAAKICLDGYRLNPDILYFVNPQKATSSWVMDNCKFVMRIQNHDFYA